MNQQLLTEGEWALLEKDSDWFANGRYRYKPFTAEDAERGRQAILEKRKIEKEAYKKAYADMLEKMLGVGAQVQMIALQRAVDEAVDPETGEIDPKRVNAESLKIALSVTKEVADRVVGKATQKIEGKVEHAHKHTIWKELADSGELDAGYIEEADWKELGEGGEGA